MKTSQLVAPTAEPAALLAQLIYQAKADRAQRRDELPPRPRTPAGAGRSARPPATGVAQPRRRAGRRRTDGDALAVRRTAFPGSGRSADTDDALSRPPSLRGGTRIQGRALGRQGRQTVNRLRRAGLAEFRERGFHAVRVDDVARRAGTSHGTFYLYFASKEDLFRTLLHDALHDMWLVAGDFPVVTPNEAGRAALRAWVQRLCTTYAAHATVLRIFSQAEMAGEKIWADGLQPLYRRAAAITRGMIAAAVPGCSPSADGARLSQREELTAIACLMMLERANYLLSADIGLPRAEMMDRLSAIIYAAFQAS